MIVQVEREQFGRVQPFPVDAPPCGIVVDLVVAGCCARRSDLVAAVTLPEERAVLAILENPFSRNREPALKRRFFRLSSDCL
jgi:hypothetical protein